MPAYDFRCTTCGTESTLAYPSVAAYSAATPLCPACGQPTLTRQIRRVSIARASRDYARMNSQQMLSVLESGDVRAAQQMVEQVRGVGTPAPQPPAPPTPPAKDNAS